jgi:ParB family chromosome partitioning protein
MSKEREILGRFGANLAESMGAGRVARAEGPAPTTGATRHDGCTRLRAAAEIEIDRIIPDPNQPRVEFDEESIDRLAESLKTHGQLQPISVRWSEDMGRYLIVTGERRWRAATRAGRATLAAVVIEGDRTESQILEMQLVENCLREDLKPVEQARAFRALMDRNGWPALRVAEVLHLSTATVARALSLLDLPCTVQSRVEAGELPASVAYELSKVEDADEQRELAERVVTEGMSRAETVKAVRSARGSKGRGAGNRKRETSRVFRSAAARVTVELRRGTGAEAIRNALVDALATMDGETKERGAA